MPRRHRAARGDATSWPRSATPTPACTRCWWAPCGALADDRSDPTLARAVVLLEGARPRGRRPGPRRVCRLRRARRRGGAGGLRPGGRRHAVPGAPQRPAHEPGRAGAAAAHPRRATWPRCWRGRRPRPPTRWPSWPPRRWRSTSTGASARCARPPAFDPLRRLRPRPVLPGALRLLRLRHLHRPRPPHGALRRRLRPRAAAAPSRAADLAPATSVFFGGGTPSRLHPETLCRILDAIPRAPGAEVTVECNPEDADDAHLGAYRRAGVTRVSFGLQSTQRPRARRPRPAPRAPRRRDHRRRGRTPPGSPPGTSISSSAPPPRATTTGPPRSTDVLALEHPPPHLSAYGLTVEPGTPLARDPARHPDDDVAGPALRARRGGPHRGGLRLGGDLQLGPARPRVPAQPPLLGAGRLRRHRLGGPLAPRRHALVERAHARPLRRPPSRPGARPRPAARS